MMLHGSKASQHQRDLLRRCFRFEKSQLDNITNCSSYWSPEEIVTISESPTNYVDLDIQDSSHVDVSANSSGEQVVNLPKPTSNMFASQSSGKSCFTISKSSGIGLHLNSIVNAVPMGEIATASLKSDENKLSMKFLKSESFTNVHLPEGKKGDAMSLKLVEKVSICPDDREPDMVDLIVKSSTASLQSYNAKLLNSCLLKQTECSSSPHDKRISNSENVDNFEEFDQFSPKMKSKKVTNIKDGDGCKRCNCKRSKCLKLYCDCFAAGMYCFASCACIGCFNKPDYKDIVLETRQQIKSRNPLAFSPKVVQYATETPANSGEDENWLAPSSARHKRGCNCKKSMCLKKYCECYQSNVGCSDGCRCEGCKNVYGTKEEYGLIKQMVSRKASDERFEAMCNERLKMAHTENAFLHAELFNGKSLTPLTPFQYSDHGKGGAKFYFPSREYLPSSESDLTILSSHVKSPSSLRNSDNLEVLLKSSGEIMDIVSCHQESNIVNAEELDLLTSRSGLASVYHLSPLENAPSTSMVSSTSCKTREHTNITQYQLCLASGCPSSGSSLCLGCSPICPVTQLATRKVHQGLDSDSLLYDLLEDDTPEILDNASACGEAVKISSPKRMRISPHSHLNELGSSSSASLRSAHKFILQVIPSLPPLTPCIESKRSINDNKNYPQW